MTLFDEPFLRKLERLAIISRRALAGQMQGERRSPKRGGAVEFADFRPYVLGDDIRRIDWNAYARLERFFIKLFVEEEDLTIHLLIDASRSMDWGQPNKLEYALRAAGALGYIAMSGLDRVTVTILGYNGNKNYFPPARGKRQALTLFTFLESIISNSKSDIRNSPSASEAPAAARYSTHDIRHYAAQASHPGPLVLFSDLMGDGWSNGLTALAARGFEPTVVHILSPDEVDPGRFAEPPLDGDFKLLDSESEAEVEITADFETLERYQQGLAAWREELRRFCTARSINYAPVETSVPLEELLFAWLRRQGVLW